MRESVDLVRKAQQHLAYAREQLQDVARMLAGDDGPGRRRMSVTRMRTLELAGVRQMDIALQAGISDRHVRSLLSQVRTRRGGRPIGSLDRFPRRLRSYSA